MATVAPSSQDLPRVRTFTRGSLTFVAATTTLLPVIDLGYRDDSSAARVAIAVAVLLVGVEQTRLLLGAMGEVKSRELIKPQVLIAGVLALGLLALPAAGARTSTLGIWALPYASLLGAVVLWLPADRRRWPIAGGAALGAAAGALAATLGNGEAISAAIVAAITVIILAASHVVQLWTWNVTVRLEESRATAAELAVLRERLRFSADLHDVQGHHLQAISLKAELTRRLIGTDDDAARGHAADVQQLTLAALAETRDLVRGYRKVGLMTEVENAVQILRAAGIETTIAGTPEHVPETLQPLFGSLVREGATNLLRHAQATRCTLSVDIEGPDVVLRIQDDGRAIAGRSTNNGSGTGVIALRERFVAVGGGVEAKSLPDHGFALIGRAPR